MQMGGFRIGTIKGIPIRIHVTFLIALPFLALGFARVFTEAADLADVPPERMAGSPLLWGLVVALFLFASVLIHELAHSLYALHRGGKVRDITLLMIGGVSQIAEPPRRARDEAVMALAGPLVSLILGGVLYGLHVAVAGTTSFALRFGLFYLGSLNVVLGLFNLLPAFPMDGGRIVRAVLRGRLGMVRATQIAAALGKGFALLFALWGFLAPNLLLILIAFFVFIGAEGETRSVLVQAVIGRLQVRDLMRTEVCAVPAQVTVHEAAERMLSARQLACAVIRDGRALGWVSLDAIQVVPAAQRASTVVEEIATEAPVLAPSDRASKAFRMMAESEVSQLAVAEEGRLVGVLSRDDIVRGFKLGELEASQRRRPPPRGLIPRQV
jgi:Zn-dependent protease